MSETAKKAEKEELVEILIPKIPGGEKTTFFSLNGENIVVPHGKQFLVKPWVLEVYKNSLNMLEEAEKKLEKAADSSKNKIEM